MVDYTPRLKLPRLDLAGGEIANGYPQVQNDLANLVDANAGAKVCTSTTRPATPYQGQIIYETDRKAVAIYDGGWRYLGLRVFGSVWFAYEESITSGPWQTIGNGSGTPKPSWNLGNQVLAGGVTFTAVDAGIRINVPPELDDCIWDIDFRVGLTGGGGGRITAAAALNSNRLHSSFLAYREVDGGVMGRAFNPIKNNDILSIQVYQDSGSTKTINPYSSYMSPWIRVALASTLPYSS